MLFGTGVQTILKPERREGSRIKTKLVLGAWLEHVPVAFLRFLAYGVKQNGRKMFTRARRRSQGGWIE